MAIRLRTIDGVRIALCAVESDEKDNDLYLDDADHYALAAKFCRDWHGKLCDWSYPLEYKIMDTQKIRNAQEELYKNLKELKCL